MSYELSGGVEGSSGRVGSAGIDNHPPLLGLVGSAGAVAAGSTVGLPALAAALTVAGVAVSTFGAADDRPGTGGGLAGRGDSPLADSFRVAGRHTQSRLPPEPPRPVATQRFTPRRIGLILVVLVAAVILVALAVDLNHLRPLGLR